MTVFVYAEVSPGEHTGSNTGNGVSSSHPMTGA